MKSSGCAFLALILALIVGGAYYFYIQKNVTDNKPLTGQEGISDNSAATENNNLSLIEPEKVNLTDVSGGEGLGQAKRIFTSNKFVHTITAQLKAPDTGSYYAGWLTNSSSGTEEFISTGKFDQTGSDYYLEFRSEKDYSNYNKVVVSLQTKETVQPEKVILEGEFK